MSDPVVNELSFCRFKERDQPSAAANQWEARSWMNSFVRTLAETTSIGLSRSLRTLDGFSYRELTTGYSVVQWSNDRQVPRDERQLFKQYATKSPLLNGMLERIVERESCSEARFQGVNGRGLLAAFLLDTLAVSLPSDTVWQSPRLKVAINELGEDEELRLTDEFVLHAASPEHVREHAQLFETKRRDLAASGWDIVQQMGSLLPKIRFCGNVEDVLIQMGPNDDRLSWVRRSLFELNDHCNSWSEGEFQHNALRGSPTPESESVNNNPELRRLRVFSCPDGEQRYFGWHLKSKNLRINYFPKDDEHVVLVGYIGPHLPTARY